VNATPAVAIFDMDGTLTRADTFLAYLKFVFARRKHRLGNCLGLPLAVTQFQLGMRARDWLKQEFVRAVLGASSTPEIEVWTAAFVDQQGARLLKPAAAAALRWHRSRGDRLIIASASLDIYTRALAASWDVPEVVCTKLEWQSGILTGRLSGPNLRGEAKLAAVKNMLDAVPGARPWIFGYSDDYSDLPLLKFADQGFAVDPTRKLASCAAREGLQIVSWKGADDAGSLDNTFAMLPAVAHAQQASLINKT
jgi:HAD superfamily hydrolase (TIGR01490 family)